MTTRPFRAPHHSISPVALVGGGSNPQPGEISLAHNGGAFLRRASEFSRNVLGSCQPLEERIVTVARARYTVDYPPASCLVAAIVRALSGYHNHPTHAAECAPQQVQRYLGKGLRPCLTASTWVEIVPVDFESSRMPVPPGE